MAKCMVHSGRKRWGVSMERETGGGGGGLGGVGDGISNWRPRAYAKVISGLYKVSEISRPGSAECGERPR